MTCWPVPPSNRVTPPSMAGAMASGPGAESGESQRLTRHPSAGVDRASKRFASKRYLGMWSKDHCLSRLPLIPDLLVGGCLVSRISPQGGRRIGPKVLYPSPSHTTSRTLIAAPAQRDRDLFCEQ